MRDFISNIFRILTLKSGPQDLVYSKFLLLSLMIIDMFIYVSINSFLLEIAQAQIDSGKEFDNQLLNLTPTELWWVAVVKELVLFLSLYLLLLFFNKVSRFVQACTAMIAINISFAIFFILIIILFQISGFAFVLFFVLLYWKFMVVTNIFVHSFDTEIIKSGFLALAYLLLQHYVGNVFLNLLVA